MARVRVIEAGLQTTAQDLGRSGWAHLGVAPSGAADDVSLRLGNRVVGNEDGCAASMGTAPRSGPGFLRSTDSDNSPPAAVVPGASLMCCVRGAMQRTWDAGQRIGPTGAELHVIRKRLQTLRNRGFSWLKAATVASLAMFAAGEALAATQAAIVVDAKTGTVLGSLDRPFSSDVDGNP